MSVSVKKAATDKKKAGQKAPKPIGKTTRMSERYEDAIVPPQYGKGPVSTYWITAAPQELNSRRIITPKDKILLGIISFLSSVIRVWGLSYPNVTIFDEVHFGGFAQKYLKGLLFIDVHPPLAKMLFAIVAKLSDFDGIFNFSKIGTEYTANVPYVQMRSYPAFLGALTSSLFFLTLKTSGVHSNIAFVASLWFIFENANVMISRFILLDAPLIFFMALTIYAFEKFDIQKPFTLNWCKYLFISGLGLGLTVSSKWVGLFTVTWMGLLTVYQLWQFVGDLTVTPRQYFKHFSWRVIALIMTPLSIYLALWQAHFKMLNKNSLGSLTLSPEFRNTMENSGLLENLITDVYFGSKITLKHVGPAGTGTLLHSHPHNYKNEKSSKQQQVTGYSYQDKNNFWTIDHFNRTLIERLSIKTDGLVKIQDGFLLSFQHASTNRKLHSHNIRPPVTTQEVWQNEVSAYGGIEFKGDANDQWKIEIDKKLSEPGEAQENILAVKTKFRLVHTSTGCKLFSHDVKLPDWGFNHQEITCATNANPDYTVWMIEENHHPDVDETDARRTNYTKLGFIPKVLELHKVMWKSNAALTLPHHWQSTPESWPLMLRGINYYNKDGTHIYLLGNIFVWWAVTFTIVAYTLFKTVQLIRWENLKLKASNDAKKFKHPVKEVPLSTDPLFINSDYHIIKYILGWAIHYFPSFLMERQLFIHHYLPAYYFGILALAHFVNLLVNKFAKVGIKKYISRTIIILFTFAVIGFFLSLSPLIYGLKWTKSQCERTRLISTWDYYCQIFPEEISDYAQIEAKASLDKLNASKEPLAADDIEEFLKQIQNIELGLGDKENKREFKSPEEEKEALEILMKAMNTNTNIPIDEAPEPSKAAIDPKQDMESKKPIDENLVIEMLDAIKLLQDLEKEGKIPEEINLENLPLDVKEFNVENFKEELENH